MGADSVGGLGLFSMPRVGGCRELLVHLNVSVPAYTAGEWEPDEVGDAILAALERGFGLPEGALADAGAPITVALTEEI